MTPLDTVLAVPPSPAPTDVLPTAVDGVTAALSRAAQALNGGRLEDAARAYGDVLAIDPCHADALINRGVTLRRLNRVDESLACYWRALAAGGDPTLLWTNISVALGGTNRVAETRAALDNLHRLAPLRPPLWSGLATLALRNSHPLTGEACLRRATYLDPQDSSQTARLAHVLSMRGELLAAERLYAEARRLAPLNADAHAGFGQTMISQGRLDEAERHLRRAIELQTDHLDARLGLARLLLLKGDLRTGWVEYEWRRRKSESKIPKMPGKEWSGEPLAGRTIAVVCEQGQGDVLQFCRYVPILAAQGARVTLLVPPPLERLMRGLAGVNCLATSPRTVGAYDYHIPMLSIPRILGITFETIPARIPYLAPTVAVASLPVPLGTRLKVGIAWAGSPTHANDRNRSVSLETLLPLAALAGVSLYSLQTGPNAGDIGRVAHPALVRDLSHGLRDFADTAAVVQQLDLVITVDTSVAHLAGALGKPVWVLTSYAPDWRWVLGRDDTPWYPSMRLYRQSQPGRWDDVVDRLRTDLAALAADRPAYGEAGETVVNAIFSRPDGQPRFRMWAPRRAMNDVGVRYLIEHEWSGEGYEYATRAFIDAHLRPGDLFIDVGAHWGIMALQAATRFPGQVKVLACEPLPANLPHLRRWIADNGLAEHIEVIPAAVSDHAGTGGLMPESSMGHRLLPIEGGGIPVVTIDGLLAERPDLASRRVVVKIDVEGLEPEVVAGMAGLLASGRVAAVVWERGHTYDEPDQQHKIAALRDRFAALGFTAWMFAGEAQAGALLPFVDSKGWLGNIFELAADEAPLPSYGEARRKVPPQPDDPVQNATRQCRAMMAEASNRHAAGKVPDAMQLYGRVAALDNRWPDLYNNIAVTLRSAGHLAAAEAGYRRSLALRPRNAGVISNLANVLRERGRMAEAEALHAQAVTLSPENPRLLYNQGLVMRDDGRPAEAEAIFRHVLELEPDNGECRWDLALSLLQQGNYHDGWPGYESRWGLARSQPRKIPLPRWDGSPLAGQSVFLHDEQGFGDVLQWARFIPEVKRRGAGQVILECQPELMRLMALAPGVDRVVPRGSPTPACDVMVPLLTLPSLFGTTLENLPATVPYLRAPEPVLPLPDAAGQLRMGLVWAGKPTPRDRSCPLETLLPALGDPRFTVHSLQMGPRAADLQKLGADLFIRDLAPRLHDFAETAAVLTKLDLLVTIDTSVAHLAGALGVPTFLLLRYTSDWRWFDRGSTSPWYPSMRIFRQPADGLWEPPVAEMAKALSAFAEGR